MHRNSRIWLVLLLTLVLGCGGGGGGEDPGGGIDPGGSDPGGSDPGGSDPAPSGDCTAIGVELVNAVNAYRAENGLPAIPLSPSLCFVANAHVGDLSANAPHAAPGCNLHSWSDQGTWTSCCYTSDHAQAACMWDKPGQLTSYPGPGYENAASGVSTAARRPRTLEDLARAQRGDPQSGHLGEPPVAGAWRRDPRRLRGPLVRRAGRPGSLASAGLFPGILERRRRLQVLAAPGPEDLQGVRVFGEEETGQAHADLLGLGHDVDEAVSRTEMEQPQRA